MKSKNSTRPTTNFTARWHAAVKQARRPCSPEPCHVPAVGWLSLLTMAVIDSRPVPSLGRALIAVPQAPVWYFTIPANFGIYGHDRVKYIACNSSTKLQYNRMLKNRWFWDQFTTRLVLLFEKDTSFCARPTLTISFFVAEMVEYDYALLGAPWLDDAYWCRVKGRCSGNSGLSIWSVAPMQRFAREGGRSSAAKIDSFMHAIFAGRAGVDRLPPTELAEKFAMETTRRRAWFTPFGCHKSACCPNGRIESPSGAARGRARRRERDAVSLSLT